MTVNEEQRRHFSQQSFGHTIKQHEKNGDGHFLHRHLGKESHHRMFQLTHQLTAVEFLHSLVIFGFGKNITVIKPKGNKKTCHAIEHQAPGVADGVAEHHLQVTGNHDEDTLSEDGSQTIESAADSYEPCLLVLIKT